MRYAQGGGFTAEEQERREQVRLRAVKMFEGTQLAWLEDRLRAGPLAAGYRDQRWTLARIRDLITAESGVGCGTCCAATAGPASWACAAPPSATRRG